MEEGVREVQGGGGAHLLLQLLLGECGALLLHVLLLQLLLAVHPEHVVLLPGPGVVHHLPARVSPRRARVLHEAVPTGVLQGEGEGESKGEGEVEGEVITSRVKVKGVVTVRSSSTRWM